MLKTHEQILAEIGATALAERLFPHLPAGRWADASKLANTVQAWKRSKSIPGEYWRTFDLAGIATVEALMAAAELKRLGGSPTADQCAGVAA